MGRSTLANRLAVKIFGEGKAADIMEGLVDGELEEIHKLLWREPID